MLFWQVVPVHPFSEGTYHTSLSLDDVRSATIISIVDRLTERGLHFSSYLHGPNATDVR